MTYTVGDVFLKVDPRVRHFSGFDTRHHAMLVIDIEDGHPVVAHMKFTDWETKRGSLVIEPCKACNELIHLPSDLSETTQQKLQEIVETAKRQKQLTISAELLAQEYSASEPYQTYDPLEKRRKIQELLDKFPCEPTDILNPEAREISCHDFVLSAIQLACLQSGQKIPEFYHFPPRFAWANLLYHHALNCQAGNRVKFIQISPKTQSCIEGYHFFAPPAATRERTKPSSQQSCNGCVCL